MDKQQILVIWWWEALENLSSQKFLTNRLEYIRENYEYNPYNETKKWKQTLQRDLGENYEVLKSPNPCTDCAVYEEWKIMFEKTFPCLSDNIILLWHSLWGTFIAKYLNENDFSFIVKKILLVVPAFEDSEQEVLGSFNFDKSLEKFKKYSDKITMYYSTDDFVVPVSDFENFKAVLPEMKYREFNDRWHFLWEEFPEILEDIKNV